MWEWITLAKWKFIVSYVVIVVIWWWSRWFSYARGHHAKNNNKEKRGKLSKQYGSWIFITLLLMVIISMITILCLWSPLIMLIRLSTSSVLRLKDSTSEKHIEYFFWIYTIIKTSSTSSSCTLVLAGFFTSLIIIPLFLRCCKTYICCRYFLKSLRSLWCMIFIWMEFYC